LLNVEKRFQTTNKLRIFKAKQNRIKPIYYSFLNQTSFKT
jgi:hypothetical protein